MQSTQQAFFIDLAQDLGFELRIVISLYTQLNFRVIYIYIYIHVISYRVQEELLTAKNLYFLMAYDIFFLIIFSIKQSL